MFTVRFFLLTFLVGAHCKPTKPEGWEQEVLEWPEKYSFEISKYDILSGVTEDIKFWRTQDESRVEYNGGAVKTFVTAGKNIHSRGFVYELHPETPDEDNVNKIVCQKTSRRRLHTDPTDILPDPYDFYDIGEEQMKDQNCSVFYYEGNDDGVQKKETIWAYYDEEAGGWVPVRYEVEAFNNDLGSFERHDLWEFEGYNADFDEKEVFDASEFCKVAKQAPIRRKENDKAITRHLHFIDPENEKHVDHVFKHFKKDFKKKYAHQQEHEMRKRIFKKNLRKIKTLNRKNWHMRLAVNHFADRTPEEMKRYMGLRRRPEGKHGLQFPYTNLKVQASEPSLPAEYDLRLEGIISPVQNQETCGSCWTFGTTSAVEGALARYNGGNIIRLSNQALIDCAWEFEAGGCDGGTDYAAYEWISKYGLPTIAEYGTYKNQDGYCHIQNVTKTYKIKGYVDVTPNSVAALKYALINNGPLSVSVHVTDTFVSYESGTFYDFECSSNPSSLNHEVTLVGYGREYGEDYWILKNSWGPEWGLDGFMHIAVKDNICGVMTEPTYVLF